jgi:hypothetical protein
MCAAAIAAGGCGANDVPAPTVAAPPVAPPARARAPAPISRFDFSRDDVATQVQPAILATRAYALRLRGRGHLVVLKPGRRAATVHQFNALLARVRTVNADFDPSVAIAASQRWLAVSVSRGVTCEDGPSGCYPQGGILQVSRPHGTVRTLARCASKTPVPIVIDASTLVWRSCTGEIVVSDLDRPTRRPVRAGLDGGAIAVAGSYVAAVADTGVAGSSRLIVVDLRTRRPIIDVASHSLFGYTSVALQRDGTAAVITKPTTATKDPDPYDACGTHALGLAWASRPAPRLHRLAGEPCSAHLSLLGSRLLYIQHAGGSGRTVTMTPAIRSLAGGPARPIRNPGGWQQATFASAGRLELANESCDGPPIVTFTRLTDTLRDGTPPFHDPSADNGC